MTSRVVAAPPAALRVAVDAPRLPAAGSLRWPWLSTASEYLLDGLMLVAIAFSIPFVILLVGTPLALGLRALLWLFE